MSNKTMTVEQRINWTVELERRNNVMSDEIQELAISNLKKIDQVSSLHDEIQELKVKHSVQYGQQLDMFEDLKKDYLNLLSYVKEIEGTR